MNFKNSLLIICLIICMFAMAGVCATDTDDMAITATEDSLEIDQATDDVLCVEENIELDSSVANEVLKANVETFTQLDTKINGNTDKDIYLESDYKYFEDDVIDFREGIVINRDVNIHGNGHTIDANGESRIFQINGGNVVFYNITFVNGVTVGDDCGAAINGDCNAINCTFKQNHGSYWGGAMCGGFAINCTFIDNSAGGFGGAMSDGYAVNCIFINNTADYAGALSNGSAVNCIFTGNRAWGWGGAMAMASAVNCTFVDNRANEYGGAMYECSAVNCIFTGNYAELSGAAMHTGYAMNCSGQTNDFYSISELVLHFEAKDLITLYGSGETLPIKLRNQNNELIDFIDYDVVIRNKNAVVTTYHCLSNDDLSFDLLPGIYTAELVVTCPCLSQTDRKSITLTVTDGKTFWDLNKTINGNSNKVINLDKDYAYNPDFDSDFTEGIDITRKVTINGNGHSIDGNGQASIFWVNGDNVNINNITFLNGNASNGGAITWVGANGRLSASNFTNNNAKYGYGGAIEWEGDNGMVSASSFTNNNAVNGYGGAIYWGGADGTVSGSSFTDNNAEIENGGAIYWWGSNGIVSGCGFTDNKAKDRYGGAIYWWSSNGIISGSSFIGNNAANSGGAIFCKDANGNISNSIFINNNAGVDGDAIYSDVLLMADCCWFGANATNYMDALPIGGNAHCERILFLNATANPDTISVSGTSDVIFKLFLFNSSGNITEYDNTPFKNINLTITPTNGNVSENISKLAEPITFTATGRGTGGITAKIENAVYTIELNIKFDPNLSFDSQQSDYSDNTIIAIGYNQSATGTVNITLKGKNGNKYAFTNIALNAAILLQEAINADEYEVNVTYSGNHDFMNATATGTLTINKANSTLSVNDITFDYNDEGSCEFSYTEATGVEAKVIGHGEAVVDVTGNIITVSGLDAGNYTLSVTTITDENHNNVTKTANIAVNKIDSSLTVNDATLDYGTSTNVTVTTEGATGISAKINGADVGVVDNFTITISGLDAGTYNLTVTTMPDADHNPVSMNATITVNPLQTQWIGDAITATYNVNMDLVITLKDSKGNSLAGVSVTVVLNGAKTYVTDKNGQVKISTEGLAPKAYTAKVTFNGNANYVKSTKDIKVTVKKATPKMTAKKKTFKKSVKVKKYSVVLKDNRGKAIKKANVSIKVGKKTVKAKTNSKGKATFKIKKLTKKGTYKTTVTYKGNAYYNKVTKKVKIKIK